MRKKLEAEELNPLKLLAVEMRKSPGDKVRISVERGSPGGESDGSKSIPINISPSSSSSTNGGSSSRGGSKLQKRPKAEGGENEIEMKREIDRLRYVFLVLFYF